MTPDSGQASTEQDAKILYLTKDSSILPITLGAPIAAAGGKNFVKVSPAAVKCVGLTAAYIFARIAYRCDWPDQTGRYWEATYEDIVEDTGLNVRTVRRYVKTLVDKEWLEQPVRAGAWNPTNRFVVRGVADHSRNSAEGQSGHHVMAKSVSPMTDLATTRRPDWPPLLIQDSVRLNPDGAGSVGTSMGGQVGEDRQVTPEQLRAIREKVMGIPPHQETGPARR